MSGKGFLGNMTENLQADCVQSRQAGFIQCFPYIKDSGHVPLRERVDTGRINDRITHNADDTLNARYRQHYF